MIDSLRRFLAHAVMLESSAVEGYALLAAQMREREQPALAELFRTLGDFSQLHRDETMHRFEAEVGHALVHIDDYHWPDGSPPENPKLIDVGPGMTPRRALEEALKLEQAACDYYVGVAGQTRDAQVQELAQTFAEEEAEHVAALERWIERLDRSSSI
jgi:rubrerythrin